MSTSGTQKNPKSSLSLTFKSEKPHLNPNLRVVEDNSLSTKTPEKPQHFRHKSHREATQKQSKVQIDSARRKMDSLPQENPTQTIQTHFGASEKLPVKYEILGEFFDCLDASIRLLRLRGLMPSFTNIRPKVECLTDRRFTYRHLAQLKFILPEVIEMKKVLVKDERTDSMKPDLHVTMNVDAVENDGKLKSGGAGHMHLRMAFRERLADISKSHPEGYEIPQETLPQPFNCANQDIHRDSTKFPLSSSPEVLTDVKTVEKPEALTPRLQGDEIPDETSLQGDEIPDETHQIPSNQSSFPIETSFEAPIEQQPAITSHLPRSFRRHFSKPSFQAQNVSVPDSNLSIVCSVEEASTAASSYGQVLAIPTKEIGLEICLIEGGLEFQHKEDVNSNISGTPNPPLPIETSFEASIEQQPAITAHLPRSFRSHFSNASFQARNVSVPESNLNIVSSAEEATTAISSHGQVPATPTKEKGPIEDDDGLHTKTASIQSTPAKLASTPASVTPALHPQKRCYMSPDDNCTSSPEKLVRYPPRCRSLKFDTPVKNKKVEDDDGLHTKTASIQSTPAKLALTPASVLHPPKCCYMSPDDNSTTSPEKLVRDPPPSSSLKFDTPVKNKKVEDEALDMDGASIDNAFDDFLQEDLLQLLKDKERKAIEERNPAISLAKRQQQMISSLPKLFNMIHFLFQSMNRSTITKEELVHKIIWVNCDFVDRKEVEEQLALLLELVPQWISEKKLASGEDLLLICINKKSNPDSVRAQLEAK